LTTFDQTQKTFRGKSKFFQKRKVCHFCLNKISYIDYKDINTLRRYISDQNKIESSRKTGVCPKHQRALSTAIKRARILSLLPSDGSHGSARLSMRSNNSYDKNSETSNNDKKINSSKESTSTEANTEEQNSNTDAENTQPEANAEEQNSNTDAENIQPEANAEEQNSNTDAENIQPEANAEEQNSN